MIAVDTNILVAALRSEYEHHERAAARLRELAEGSSPWAIPWPCAHELLAVVTNPRIFREPLSPQHAADAIDALLESPTARLIAEGPGYWPILRQLVTETKDWVADSLARASALHGRGGMSMRTSSAPTSIEV